MLTSDKPSHRSGRARNKSAWRLSIERPFIAPSIHRTSLMFLLSLLTVHLCSGLSIEGNLASGRAHGQHHHPEWSVDDWWRETMKEDVRKQFADRFQRLRSLDFGAQSRAFDSPLEDEDDGESQLRNAHDVAQSTWPFGFDQAVPRETMESAQSMPSKRRWSTKVQYPQPPQTSADINPYLQIWPDGMPVLHPTWPESHSQLPQTSFDDLVGAESFPMKSSTGSNHFVICQCIEILSILFSIGTRNQLHPLWRTQVNQTKTQSRKPSRENRKDAPSTDTQQSYVPKSALPSIQNLFNEYFTTVRSSTQESSRASFLELKRNLRRKFLDLNLFTGIQSFNVSKIRVWQPVH